jgi:hypothetical protein
MAGIINFTDKSLWNVQGSNYGINNINVPTLGEVNQIMQGLGGLVAYGSQDDLGKRIVITEAGAADYTYTPNGTLFGGVYQLVKVDSGATAAQVAVGHAAFLKVSGAATYSVTAESQADSIALFAGVFLNTITPGNYGAILVSGKVNALFKTSITNGAPAVGDGVFVGGGSGLFDDLTAGTITIAQTCDLIGKALVAPASTTMSAIQIQNVIGRY